MRPVTRDKTSAYAAAKRLPDRIRHGFMRPEKCTMAGELTASSGVGSNQLPAVAATFHRAAMDSQSSHTVALSAS